MCLQCCNAHMDGWGSVGEQVETYLRLLELGALHTIYDGATVGSSAVISELTKLVQCPLRTG